MTGVDNVWRHITSIRMVISFLTVLRFGSLMQRPRPARGCVEKRAQIPFRKFDTHVPIGGETLQANARSGIHGQRRSNSQRRENLESAWASLVYPELGHINNLRKYEKAEFSLKARAAYARGDKILIEHVSPLRDLTRRAIHKIDELDDDGFAKFVKKHFCLVLLTPEETAQLNRQNRSEMSTKGSLGNN